MSREEWTWNQISGFHPRFSSDPGTVLPRIDCTHSVIKSKELMSGPAPKLAIQTAQTQRTQGLDREGSWASPFRAQSQTDVPPVPAF